MIDILPDAVLDGIEPEAYSAYRLADQGTGATLAVLSSIAISLRRLANTQEESLRSRQGQTTTRHAMGDWDR